jgi:Putative phage abortive infection protein
MQEEKDDTKQDSLWPLWILCAIVISIWTISMFWLKDQKERGTFGDMFGGVNALFSGLALAGIIYTIFLQKKELGLQRKELRDTRKEFSTQNETLRLQRFENTFFQMLNLHHQIIDKLAFERQMGDFTSTEHEKREVFMQAVSDLRLNIDSIRRKEKQDEYGQVHYEYEDITNMTLQEVETQSLKAYKEFYFMQGYQNALSHYFRNVYHTFKFIHKTKLIAKTDKRFYSSIVRAQLSSDELFLLFYNSMAPNLGNPNFLFLMKEYDVLQNFDFSLIENRFHKEIYDKYIESVENPFMAK